MSIDYVNKAIASMAKLKENFAKEEAKGEKTLKKEPNEFPIEVFPKKLQAIIRFIVYDQNYPLDFICSAILHAASSAIGNTIHLNFKWHVSAILYMAFIGDPGTSKSHPIEWAYKPIEKVDDRLYAEYERQMTEYESLKIHRKPDPGIKEPVLNKLIVSDTTIEALNRALMHNRRFVAVVADELSGFINSMGRNQQQYLSLWSGKPHTIDRKTSKVIRIRQPFASIIWHSSNTYSC